MSSSLGWSMTFTVAEHLSCQSAQNPIGCLLKSSSRMLNLPLKLRIRYPSLSPTSRLLSKRSISSEGCLFTGFF